MKGTSNNNEKKKPSDAGSVVVRVTVYIASFVRIIYNSVMYNGS